MKYITKLKWRMPKPAKFPCLFCKSGREATQQVIINDTYYLTLCVECASLPENKLIPNIKKAVK